MLSENYTKSSQGAKMFHKLHGSFFSIGFPLKKATLFERKTGPNAPCFEHALVSTNREKPGHKKILEASAAPVVLPLK